MPISRKLNIWQSFVGSFDHGLAALSHCNPVNTGLVVFIWLAVVFASRYIPAIHAAIGLKSAFWPATLGIVAGATSIAARLSYPRPNLVALFCLFDTPFYGAAIVSLAVLSVPPAAHVFVGFWLVAALNWGTVYSFTILGTAATIAGPSIVAVVGGADFPTATLILLGSCLYVFVSRTTRDKREREARSARAEDVLKRIDNLLQDHRSDVFGEQRIHIASLFHELRNEIAAASWNIDYLSKEAKLPSTQSKVLDETKASMKDVAAAIEGFIEEMRVRSDEGWTFRLGELVEVLELEVSHRAERGVLTIDGMPQVKSAGSVDYMRIVVFNLIDNAFEAGATGVKLGGAISHGGTSVSLSITDDGPGLPGPVRDRLFEPFNTHGKDRGTGLGIYLSRRMIESMGGTIGLVSTDESGTAFEIVLPLISTDGAMDSAITDVA